MLEILPPVSLQGLNYSFQFEKIFYFWCLCFRVTYLRNRALSDIASQIEEGVNVTNEKKVSELVASWILVRGKGGGFGRRMYVSVARVFRGLCTLPPYKDVRDFWHDKILPPIHTCREGTSQVVNNTSKL